MGLPTNQAKGQGCSPVSSNCVIWQGPDIPCINLCHGDSVTDVVAKLAKELCDILKTLDIDTYDLTCFSPICPDPQNFHDMLQFLITKICELQCCCDGTKPSESACPDACIVTVASCFYFQNQLGDTISTMTLKDYVIAIGNKICENAGQIAQNGQRSDATEEIVAEQQVEINALRADVDAVTVTVPASAFYPAGTPVGTALTTIATELSNLETATGSPTDILIAIQKSIPNIDNLKTLTNRNSTYSGITGWITSGNYGDLSDSITNMWLLLGDIRSSVENILSTCCCTDCDDVDISFTPVMAGVGINMFFVGSAPVGMTDCYPQGNWITVTDSNGGTTGAYFPIISNLNQPPVYFNLTSTPVNTALNLTIVVQGCWKRAAPGADCGGLECSRVLTQTITNFEPCLTLTLGPVTETTLPWSFINTVGTPIFYSIELWNLPPPTGTLQFSQGVNNPPVGVVSDTFLGLPESTQFYVILRVTINGITTVCPQGFITTLPLDCLAPTEVSATNIIL